MAAPGASGRVRRPAACAASPPRVARAGPRATLRAFRSCGRSSVAPFCCDIEVRGTEALDPDPRQLPPLPRELVAPARQLLLLPEQLLPRSQPLLSRPDPHDISISIWIGAWSGSVTHGTLDGETATQIPSATSAAPTARGNRMPNGSTFWAKINPATTAIQKMLITPTANSTAIRPKQQPTHS